MIPLVRNVTLATAILAAIGVALVGRPAMAQDMQRIAAVVNDEIVSLRDLRNRVRMVVVTSGLPQTEETAQRLAPQVLRSLIDEQIQLQEAERLNVAVTEQDMAQARGGIEQRNGIRPGEFEPFIRSLGVDVATVERQLRAQVAWTKLVRRRFGSDVEISQEDVDDVLERMAADAGKTQKRVSEILLPIDEATNETDIRQLAERLIQQLRSGSSFEAIARQFSRSANAAVGGDIGWVMPDRMTPEIAEAVASLEAGQISAPIRTVFGIHIIRVSDSRVIAAADPLAVTVDLKQAFLPVPRGADQSVRTAQRALAESIAESAQTCDDIADLAAEAKSPVSPDLGEMRVGELAPELRQLVAGLDVGKASAPVDMPNGVMVLMVCSRTAPPTNLPSAEQIRFQLEGQRFEILAQRYLRDLRRNAFVEMRV